MAASVSLLTLRTRVRQRADIESATGRHTDAEITDNINESISELYDLLRSAFGQSYYRSQVQFSTSAGQDTYSLQPDFLALVSVDIYLGNSAGNPRYSAQPFMESERNRYAGSFGAWSVFGAPVGYHLFGNNLKFSPVPPSSNLVQVNYVPVAPTLVGNSDAFDGINGWEEYVVLDAACKSLMKDDGFEKIQVLEARKAAMRQRITDMAIERDSGQPARVNDVLFGSNDPYYGNGGFGGFGGW